MRLTVAHDFLPRTGSVRASLVMDHFGIDLQQHRHVIAQDLDLPLKPGQVVLFTGPSGSGKSSLLRAAGTQLRQQTSVVSLEELVAGDRLLIDALPQDPVEAMQLLAQCGLGEARLLLRRPAELSDGQRYRYLLALGISQQPDWLMADEFTATLDRTLARVVAFNIRRLANRTGTGFLLATTHQDVVDDLSPDVHVQCDLDGSIRITRSEEAQGTASGSAEDTPPASVKKKRSASGPNSGSARRPVATGRISLGGITAVTSCR